MVDAGERGAPCVAEIRFAPHADRHSPVMTKLYGLRDRGNGQRRPSGSGARRRDRLAGSETGRGWTKRRSDRNCCGSFADIVKTEIGGS